MKFGDYSARLKVDMNDIPSARAICSLGVSGLTPLMDRIPQALAGTMR